MQKYKQNCHIAQDVDWMAKARRDIKSTKEYLNRVLDVNEDKRLEIKFEIMCKYAEKMAGVDNYKEVIAIAAFVEAFDYQYLRHDIELFRQSIKGDYTQLKTKLLEDEKVHQFINSYVNSRL